MDGEDAIERESVWVYPGQVFAATEPTVASTILATCVAVCIFDSKSGIGGLNHFLLPRAHESAAGCAKYGDVATRALVERLLELGAKRANLLAKAFGGKSCGLPGSIGNKNAEIALATLRQERVPVVSGALEGDRSRKLVFHTDTGRAWIREF